jgi:arsenite-transporting ATPase
MILKVFLGPGGVGKSTLSASYALALAEQGATVALLSVDPAKRLRSVLHLDQGEEVFSFGKGKVYLSLFNLPALMEDLFYKEGEKAKDMISFLETLVSSSDLLGGFKLSRWFEKHHFCDAFVLDTAPEKHALDFFFEQNVLEQILCNPLFQMVSSIILKKTTRIGFLKLKVLSLQMKPVFYVIEKLIGKEMLKEIAHWSELILPLTKQLMEARKQIFKNLKSSKTNFFYVTSAMRQNLDFFSYLQDKFKDEKISLSNILINQSLSEKESNILKKPYSDFFHFEYQNRLLNQKHLIEQAQQHDCLSFSLPYLNELEKFQDKGEIQKQLSQLGQLILSFEKLK